ncbi:hypothetical protein BGZ81_001552 [Podila clonocystis]|nr:hypothetical protein BGZ81_001552 [Podila clonocystis]
MDLPDDPHTWDAEATAKWLGATFHLPQETLQLFIEQEVDGEVLLNHLNDEALKTEFGFKIYGVRCRMLKQIRMLKAGSPAISGRMAGLNIVGSPLTLGSPLLHGAERFDVDYAALDEQEPLVMLRSPLRISRSRHAKLNPIREHHLKDAVADSDDEDDISLMDSERSSDNDMDLSDDSVDIRESIPLSMRLQSERALQMAHSLSSGNLSATLPSTAMKKRISPVLVSAAISSVIAPPLISTSTPPTNPSDQSSTLPTHRASNTTVHTKSPTDNIPSNRTSPSPASRRRTIAPTLIQDHTDHTAPSPNHPSPRKDRKGTYLPQMGLTLANIFYNKDGTRLESESDGDDWTIRPTPVQRRSMQSGYKRLIQQNLRRIFREPPIFDLPEHTVYAPLKRKDRNVPVTVVSKSKVSPTTTTSTWDQMFQELASSTIRVELQTDDMTSFDFKAATKGLAKNREQSAAQNGENFLYPVYGESDASAYTTDEELHKQVAREELESMKQKAKALKHRPKKRPLPIVDVEQLVTQYVMDRGDRWSRIEKPKLISKRQKIYDAPNGRKFELDLLQKEIDQLKDKRLREATGVMMMTTYHTAAEVLRACKALDRTIDLISMDQWKVEILNGPDPRLDPLQIETKPAYSPKGAPMANRTRKTSIDPEEQRQRELDRAFIEDDIDMDISDDSAESEYGTAEDIDIEDADVPSELGLIKKLPVQPRTTPDDGQEASKKDKKKHPAGAVTDSPQDDVTKKRKTRDASPIEIIAKKPRDYSSMDVIVIEDEDVTNDAISSQSEDATVPTSILGNHKVSVKTETSEQPSRQHSKKVPRDDQFPRKSSGSEDTSTVDKKRVRESYYNSPQFELGKERDPSSSWSSRRGRQTDNTAMDVDPQPSQASEPRPMPRKEMETPNWMELLDLDTLPEQLRSFRRYKSRAQRFSDMEPILSAYQEYIEWIELDVEDNLSVKKFITWKRQGNTTNEYRKQAVLAAKELAEKEEKERRDKEQRDRDRKDKERREKARREKEKEKEQEQKQEQEQENETSSQRQSSSNSENPPSSRQRSILLIDDDTEDDEVLMMGKSEILEIDEVMMEGKTEIHEAGKGKGTSSGIVRKVRKRRKDDAGSSGSLSSDSEPVFKKRARPAHRFGDTDSGSDSDSDPGPTRTRLPRVALSMKDEAEHVLRIRKDAEKNELELQKRIKDQERRGQIQSTMTASGPGAILINRGHKKTEKGVPIPDFLLEHLKPHQIDGIVFMWKNVVMFDNGCILAHSMGLGKTFQVISFVYILLREIHAGNKDIPKKLRAGRVMLLLPPIVLDNWEDEFNKWIPESEQHVVNVMRLPSNDRSTISRLAILEQWYTKGGVLLLSYDLFRNLCYPHSSTPYLQGELDRIRELLLEPGASITIADEGHTIKNAEAKISIAVSKIKTTARVILTGYPLQNRLEEYWCMVDFVWPNYLGDLQTFKHNYIRPIQHGLYPDSSSNDKKVSAKKLKVLTELIKHFVMRRDQSILRATLPKKVEFVISCKLTPMQYELYQRYLAVAERNQNGILPVFHVFNVICNHPAIFRSVVGSVKEKVKNHMMQSPSTTAGPSVPTTSTITAPSDIVPFGDNVLVHAGDDVALGDNGEAANLENDDELGTLAIERAISQSQEITKEEDWSKILTSNVVSVANSFKMKILIDILVECKRIKEKVLVYSRSIPTLDFVEHLLETMGSFRYLRMDGQTAVSDRQGMINHFNAKEYDLFLVSSGSGSQGINLVSANRVVIIDVGWNPSIDEQSVARAFRYGQTRKVFVYRLQTHGTFESKVYKNNLQKLSLANRVVDKKNIAKNFTKQELNAYFEPPPKANPEWATNDNIRRLLGQPDMNDAVLAKVIEQNRECLTNVVPTTDLIREEMSDLTEADLEDIEKMIIEEKLRIQSKPGQSQPPRIGVNGHLPGLPGQPGAVTIAAGRLLPTTATSVSTSLAHSGPLIPLPPPSHHGPNVSYVSTTRYGPPQVMATPQAVTSQHPSHLPNMSYMSTARYGPSPVMASSFLNDAANGPSYGTQTPVSTFSGPPQVIASSSFLHDAVHGTSPSMTGTIVVPPRIEDSSLPGLTTEAPMPTVSTATQSGGAVSAGPSAISPVQEIQDMEKQIRQLNKDFVNTYVKDTV